MKAPGSVERDGDARLFCALRLPDSALDRILEWQGGLPSGPYRLVPRDNLHLTLAFLGRRPAAEVAAIGAELDAAVRRAEAITLRLRRYRETRSVGMLVFEDDEGAAGRLAADLHARLERLGVYRPERRAWLPHLTVVRFRTPPRLASALPDLPPLSPSGAAVYHSELRPTGAQYVVLHAVELGPTREVGG